MPRVLEETSKMEKTAPRDTTHIVFGIPMTSGAMSLMEKAASQDPMYVVFPNPIAK